MTVEELKEKILGDFRFALLTLNVFEKGERGWKRISIGNFVNKWLSLMP